MLVPEGNSDADENFIYKVASKTVGVRVQNAIDPEIAALLDEDDLSRFGSDVEDLEEDFVVQANVREEGDDYTTDNKFSVAEDSERTTGCHNVVDNTSFGDHIFDDADTDHDEEESKNSDVDKPRTRRLLDDQFDTVSFPSLCIAVLLKKNYTHTLMIINLFPYLRSSNFQTNGSNLPRI